MLSRAAPASVKRHGWVLLCALAGTSVLAAPAGDSHPAPGLAANLAALAPHDVKANVFSKVKQILAKPRGAPDWALDNFAIAAGGLDTDVHEAEILITLDSAAIGETTVELIGGAGLRLPARLRVGHTLVTAGAGAVTLAADAHGQIAGTLISSDTLNAVVIRAGGKTSPEIRFEWDDNQSSDAWVSRPLRPVPGGTIAETVTLTHNDQPLAGHQLHFYVKRVILEDDDGRRVEKEFSLAQPADAYATFDQPSYGTDANGTVQAVMRIQNHPEVIDIIRSFSDESVFLADALGRVLPPVPAAPWHVQPAAPPAPRDTTELIQRLKRFGYLYVAHHAASASDTANLLSALLQEITGHPEERPALAYYVAALYAQSQDPRSAVTWALSTARDLSDANCADARQLILQCGGTWEPSKSAPPASDDAALRAVADVYPAGSHADQLAQRTLADPAARQALSALLPSDTAPLEEAAGLYRSMSLFPQAIATYHLWLGLNGDYFSPEAASIWMQLGDCYSQQRNLPAALNCYYKSLAAGQPLQDITHRLRAAQAALTTSASTPAAPVPAGKPNPDTLDQIATLLADSSFFDDALAAAQTANTLRDTPSELPATIQRRKAVFIETIQHLTPNPLTVRGLVIPAVTR